MAKRSKITHNSSSSSMTESISKLFQETPGVMPDLVVDNIFNFCDWNTLSTCRLVCKDWYRLSLRGWLEAAPPIRLVPQENTTRGPNSDSEVTIPTFLQAYSPKNLQRSSPYLHGGIRQYKNFRLEKFQDDKAQRAQLTAFMKTFGSNITNLELINFYLVKKAIFRDILCSKYTPNLSTLKANICYGINISQPTAAVNKKLVTLGIFVAGNHRKEQFQWFKLFSHYPNLEKLELSYIRKDEMLSVIQAASKCQVAIKSLSLYFRDDGDFRPPSQDEGMHPSLESLGKLSFEGTSLKSLDILHCFPNMTTLTLQSETWRQVKIVAPAPQIPIGSTLSHLTTFDCNYYHWTTRDIGLLSQFMPNVTKLGIALTNDTFRTICGQWSQLVELTVLLVSGSMLNEEAITGISLTNSGPRNEENITKLQGLQSFKMVTDFRNRMSTYPSFSANCLVFGFLRLPLLRKLELQVSPTNSKDVLQAIQRYLPFAKLTVREYRPMMTACSTGGIKLNRSARRK